MTRNELYHFLLDLFPLVDGMENKVIGDLLQKSALDAFFAHGSIMRNSSLERVSVLLKLAKDLGYIEEPVFLFLEKGLGGLIVA